MLKPGVMFIIPLFLILGDISPALISEASAEEQQIQSIALYYSPKCPHSQRVLAYMREERISIPLKDITQDPQAKDDLPLINGQKYVPCLFVNGKPIYDEHDIIDWLSQHKDELANLPSD
jgi:glutaredoxin